MTCGIYRITNVITGDFYIGRSKNIESRWDRHLEVWCDPAKNYECKKLLKSVRRYGIKSFQFEVLEECSEEMISFRETWLIQSLRPSLNGKQGKSELEECMNADVSQYGVRNRIKELVDEMGKSRYRFWKDIGVTQNTAYGLYDNPATIPSGEVMSKICDAYGVQPKDFLLHIPEPVSTAPGLLY